MKSLDHKLNPTPSGLITGISSVPRDGRGRPGQCFTTMCVSLVTVLWMAGAVSLLVFYNDLNGAVFVNVLVWTVLLYVACVCQHFLSRSSSSWTFIRRPRHSVEWFQESINGIVESCDPRIELFAGHPPGVVVNNQHIEMSDTLQFLDSRAIFDDVETFSTPPSASGLLRVELHPELILADATNRELVHQFIQSFERQAKRALAGSCLYSIRKDAVLTKHDSEDIVDVFVLQNGKGGLVSSLLLSQVLHVLLVLVGLAPLLNLALRCFTTTVRYPVRYEVGNFRSDKAMITIPLSQHLAGTAQAPANDLPPPMYEEVEVTI